MYYALYSLCVFFKTRAAPVKLLSNHDHLGCESLSCFTQQVVDEYTPHALQINFIEYFPYIYSNFNTLTQAFAAICWKLWTPPRLYVTF